MTTSPETSRNQQNTLNKRENRFEPMPTPKDDEAHGSSKRRKSQHPKFPPPAFWDGLSVLPLCENALRELDRRDRMRWIGNVESKASPDSERRSRRRHAHSATANESCLPADQFLRLCTAESLKEIKQLARHGGPEMKEARGVSGLLEPYHMTDEADRHQCRIAQVPEQQMSFGPSSLGRRKRGTQSVTTATRSTNAYDPAFQQHLIDHHIFTDVYQYPGGRDPPELSNLAEILKTAAEPRASLSCSRFTNDDFRRFQRADAQALKEAQVVSRVIPWIEGNIGDDACQTGNVTLGNLAPLTDGSLVAAKPDTYYGARAEQVDRRVRRQLAGHIIPCSQHNLPIAPNMFLEVKGPDGTTAVAKRQIAYDLALGERGQTLLRFFGAPETIYDNEASTIGYTYVDGTLKMYATHSTEPLTPRGRPGYVMTQVAAFAMTNDINTFRQGAAAYRNGRDWAKKKRDEAIERANEMARDNDIELGSSHASGGSIKIECVGQGSLTRRKCHRTSPLAESNPSTHPADSPARKRRRVSAGTASLSDSRLKR